MKKILSCSIVNKEIKYIISKLNQEIELYFLDCALHIFPEKLEAEIKKSLVGTTGTLLIYGNKCCANMEKIAEENNAFLIGAANCIEMVLGPEMARQEKIAKTFFFTEGWLENWKHIFQQALMWDKIDARLNFGYCDRMLLVKTGRLTDLSDYDILELFEYTGLPVEFITTNLSNFESLFISALKKHLI